MRALHECDQCAYREWRDEADEPYLCPVCGYYRWSVVATEADGRAGASRASDGDEEDGR